LAAPSQPREPRASLAIIVISPFESDLLELAIVLVLLWAPLAFRRRRRAATPGLEQTLLAQRERRKAESALPLEHLLRRPGSRLVLRSAVKEARLQKGLIDARLVLGLSDGSKLRWVWTRADGLIKSLTPNPPCDERRRALRQMVGPTLKDM
jgi:hypothetical protein